MQRRYDRIITIQRATVTQSGSGATIETWADVAFQVPAFSMSTPGDEKYSRAQDVAEQEVTFTVRFPTIPSASAPLTPKDRVIYPAHDVSANAQAPGAGRVFDILGVEEVGREVDLRIRTRRRVDAG